MIFQGKEGLTISCVKSILNFSKIYITCELSARQIIYMECQALISLKIIMEKYFKMFFVAIVIGTLTFIMLWIQQTTHHENMPI